MKTVNESLDSLEEYVRETNQLQTHISYRTRIDCEWRDSRINWYLNGRACSRDSAVAALEASRADPHHPMNWRAAHQPA